MPIATVLTASFSQKLRKLGFALRRARPIKEDTLHLNLDRSHFNQGRCLTLSELHADEVLQQSQAFVLWLGDILPHVFDPDHMLEIFAVVEG